MCCVLCYMWYAIPDIKCIIIRIYNNHNNTNNSRNTIKKTWIPIYWNRLYIIHIYNINNVIHTVQRILYNTNTLNHEYRCVKNVNLALWRNNQCYPLDKWISEINAVLTKRHEFSSARKPSVPEPQHPRYLHFPQYRSFRAINRRSSAE